jgi:FkbM family methyltransferase
MGTMMNAFVGPVAKTVIMASSAMPALRTCFARVGVTPARFGNRASRVPLPGRSDSLLFTGMDENNLTYRLFWGGMNYYEPFTRTLIEHLTASSQFFVDIGANIGFFTLVAAKLNPQLRVFAFEPNPKMYALLSEHIRLNQLSNVTPNSCAVSNCEGEAQLFLSKSDMSASLLPDFQEGSGPACASLGVKTTTFDSFVRRNGLTGSVVLKVDVEGHEKEVMDGAAASIAELKPDIIVEVLEDFDPGWLDQLRKHGYRFYQITDQGLDASETVTLTKRGDFTFFNYLLTVRPKQELQQISQAIRQRARGINLYNTSKFVTHRVR